MVLLILALSSRVIGLRYSLRMRRVRPSRDSRNSGSRKDSSGRSIFFMVGSASSAWARADSIRFAALRPKSRILTAARGYVINRRERTADGQTTGRRSQSLEYPGRLIVIGAAPAGGRAVIVYAITGRSPSSQARKLVLRDGGIWVQPTDEDTLQTGERRSSRLSGRPLRPGGRRRFERQADDRRPRPARRPAPARSPRCRRPWPPGTSSPTPRSSRRGSAAVSSAAPPA